MTNEEAVTYGNELIQCSAGPLREFAELATRALRSPAPGAVAMREACLDAVRKCNVIGERGTEGNWFGGVLAALEQAEADIRALPATEPATPAVGEDEALLVHLDTLAHYQCDPGVTCGIAAKARDKIRALLADVARLQKELDGATFREERYAEDAAGARLALEDARATLAAVRKVAENYHDTDVTGDPLREVILDHCANEVLLALDGEGRT